jgi:hypothetical protein
MKPANSFKLLVITGAWNKNIFSEQWIKKYLLPEEKFSLEVDLISNSHRITSEKLQIEFHSNRINFIAKILNENEFETFHLISKLSIKIADYLPHTPVFAYGVNFIFECNEQEIEKDLIKLSDIGEVTDYGAHIVNSQYTHKIELDNIPINITISTNKDKLSFDFNFHSDIKNLMEFKDRINELQIDKLYVMASEIIKNVYLLQQ